MTLVRSLYIFFISLVKGGISGGRVEKTARPAAAIGCQLYAYLGNELYVDATLLARSLSSGWQS